MATILHLETSTTNCSVSIATNGNLVALKEDNGLSYSHAERLHLYIDQVLQMSKMNASNLDAIAISKGPGSYTGLRIGVSAAKGLCYALDLPLISIPTLQALALQAHAASGVIVPLLDARRMEAYTAVYDSKGNETQPTHAKIIDSNSFENVLSSTKVSFIGTAVEKIKNVIQHPNAVFIDNKMPSAREQCGLAYRKFQQNLFEDVAYFEPFYLKEFIAIPSKKN
jgi:tRNA threonylcarbamoyladenosine biosynthesis protein TsaB